MTKKKTEIAVNVSSGAEKVEEIEKTKEKTPAKKTKVTQKKSQTTAKGESALGSAQEKGKKTETEKGTEKEVLKISAKKANTQSSDKKAERESRMAKERVERAIRKKEEQEKRQKARAEKAKKRAEAREKRIAARKAKIAKRKAEIQAIIEKRAAAKKEKAAKRAAEKEEKLRARAHAKAARNQKRTAKKKEAAKGEQNRRVKERKDGERRNKGYGGWIAAVVSLGVVTLALATTVTVGAMEMREAQNTLIGGYRGTVYELTGIMEHVDEDLDRARISASPAQQSRILTDLLVQTRLAELDLEKLPVSAESDRNVTTFINRTAAECEKMLAKLRHGEQLSEKDFQMLEALYNSNREIRQQMDALAEKMTEKDMRCLMKDGSGLVADTIKGIEEKTLPENILSFDKKMQETDGAGTKRNAPAAPNEEKIDPVKAETLCAEYFSDYSIKEFQCVGETVSPAYAAYNVQGYDEKGTLLFAEVSQKDGTLLRFDYYEDGNAETFDFKNAERIAEDFLEKLGYEDMEVVRLRENGTMTDFTFVYEDDGVIYYPDEIRVKICRTRGVVTGFDATKYVKSHKQRKMPNVQISLEQAQGKIHEKLAVEAVRLAVVKGVGGERTAYEFFCSYGEENYFVYLDAVSGEELSIVNAKNI